jgi:hypothetical protein
MSSKMPLEWHKECLSNSLRTELEKRKYIQVLLDEADRLKARNDFYSFQIETAEKEGKLSFDSERYCVGRKKE